MRFLLLSFLLTGLVFPVIAQVQGPANNQSEFEKKYQRRLTKEYIYGVYIPKDLGDAFISLNKLIDEDTRIEFKNAPEEIVARKLHFSFGRWMIYNWGFYEGSRLSHYLNEVGVYHPDDMARFLIITYHRNLNRRQLNVKELVDGFGASRELEQQKKLEKGTVVDSWIIKKGDKN